VRRFKVTNLPEPGGTLRLDAQGSHHMLQVCRTPRGAHLVVFDGSGRQAQAELFDVQGGHAALRVLTTPAAARPAMALHLVLSLPKGPALDHALRMAVETGATHIHPAISARTVRRGGRHERWQRVLDGAAGQCGRADVPKLSPLGPLPEAIRRVPETADRRVAVPGASERQPARSDAALAVGPEGGWEPSELDRMIEQGWVPVGLGGWTMRVDTAVAVGLAAVAARVTFP